MTDIKFDPGKKLGDEIIKLNRKELCSLVSKLCGRIKAEAGTRNYRGGIYPDNININDAGEISLGLAKKENWDGQELDFLAPELYWNGTATQASDVYSLGMLLCYALNMGRLPYDGECDNPQLRRMKGDPLPVPKTAGRRLGEIIRKATSFKAEDRYQNVEQLQIMLDNCMENLYIDGSDGAQAIFRKDEGQLSEVEKMMLNIINGGDDELPEEPEAAPEKKTESGDKPEKPVGKVPKEEPPKNEEAKNSTPGKTAKPKKTGQQKEKQGTDPEKLKVYEPAKKKRSKKASEHEPVPILTVDKNPELEPVNLSSRKNIQPAVQYGMAAEREKHIAAQRKKRSGRRLASVLIICAIIVVTAIIVNKLLSDMSWGPDNENTEQYESLPIVGPESSTGIGIMIAPSEEPSPSPEAEPSPSPEQPEESTYQVIREDLSWTAARDRCIEMGGYLVVINDQEELDKVIELA